MRVHTVSYDDQRADRHISTSCHLMTLHTHMLQQAIAAPPQTYRITRVTMQLLKWLVLWLISRID